MKYRYTLLLLHLFIFSNLLAQDLTSEVNPFFGTSGDHGQLSPAASSPFGYLSIGPQTSPHIHPGYEFLAKKFLGFTHNRFEGVGCKGSGGVLFVKPFWGDNYKDVELNKVYDQASPGYYTVKFDNGLKASFAVHQYSGIHQYIFPANVKDKRLFIDFSHAFNNAFVAEEHTVDQNTVSGWIQAKTTCSVGTYKLFFCLKFDKSIRIETTADTHQLIAVLNSSGTTNLDVRVGLSSVDVNDAIKNLPAGDISQVKENSSAAWNRELAHIRVEGDAERKKLFYSLLYRAIQSPYIISAADGRYRAIDGSLQTSGQPVYNGWSIWDNYKTQLPLLSFAFTDRYQAIAWSIANLYRYGKKDYATQNEPSNTVRTEHAVVVLLDAARKGYRIDFNSIYDSVKHEVDHIEAKSPDKKLETAYDLWAFSQIAEICKQQTAAGEYLQKAKTLYQEAWQKDFKDVKKKDVDKMPARGMYQGTVWQYRWLVPYDLAGLINLCGGEKQFTGQLDTFFDDNFYCHSNEPDIQAPVYYNATAQTWKSQRLMHQIGLDTMVQNYFNTNERDVGAYIGKIYRNAPNGYLRTMDDDGGAMSSWFVLAACGIYPASVGYPVYYVNVPYFKTVKIEVAPNKYFTVSVRNFDDKNMYIRQMLLNGKDIGRTWLKHAEIVKGGTLEIIADSKPQSYGNTNLFVPSIKQ
ncbi:glycoside hydrolase family 92 protein (plasmid) [Pedobacter sp. BS3]|uniref:glycoside hydrolase domain-containing protein n=1 Tax=Pedobacter sp. BS3 TaxID=2567937 RepID=UPI0011F062F3|nr:glycoside hydrolase domain-containing protein [Pedobacter sp. BS3]TZF86092.1 glycoside hydrolase family 92 protein [Pedobacter sp. BS3]